MAHYYKIGLLVLDKSKTHFLVCEKAPSDMTDDYIMPGGQFTEDDVEECLRNEIDEELHCEVDFDTLEYIGKYTDTAAGDPDSKVSIQLYAAALIGTPVPSREIKAIHWIGKDDEHNLRVSPIVRNRIIPSLVERKILR